MKTSPYIITAFFVILSLLLSQAIATADIGRTYDINDACSFGFEPTGHITEYKAAIKIECINESGDLTSRKWSKK